MVASAQRLTAALAGRYGIERELGRGGMATVYLARDAKHGRQVAIKVLRPELAAALGSERFVREIEVAASLAHPHILPLFDSGEADGFLYYVMPYVEGESLRDRLDRETRLRVAEAIRLTAQIASALTHAHERGVVHRDIKPENILLTGDQAIVADFGIARALAAAGGERLTGTGLVIGTPAYMSPEQVFGSEAVDGRTDVYALGCVVYEMVSGRPPFHVPTPQALVARLAADAVPGLRKSNPDVPLFLERAVQRALATQPADRFPTPTAFAEALTTGTVVARIRRRDVRRRLLAAAAVVALLAGGWWIAQPAGGGPLLQSLAVLPFENLTGDAGEEHIVAGMHDALIGELARLGGLRVISRPSVLQYRDGNKPVTEIARDLDVDGVVSASFSRSGDNVRVRVHLLKARPEECSLWQDVYVRDMGDIVAMYGDVAGAIAREINVRVDPDQAARIAAPRRVNREAYEAYLRGRFAITQGGPVAVQQGLAFLHEANERDPGDPYPYVGLAIGYSILAHGPRPEVLPRAIGAARRALELDSMLAEPYAVLGQARLYKEWDWAGAEQALRRALELNPTLADARAHYAWYFDLVGPRDRALDEMRLAIESDPLDPLWPAWLAVLYWDRERYDEALVAARHAIEVSPGFALGSGMLALSFAARGMLDSALLILEPMIEREPGARGPLAGVYTRAGRFDDARRLAAEMEATGARPENIAQLPFIYVALGDNDRALFWLEQSFERPHPWAPWLLADRRSAPLRDEPRFQALVQRLDLPR